MSTTATKSGNKVVIASLDGLLESSLLQGVTPITEEEEALASKLLKEARDRRGLPDDEEEQLLGEMLPHEKALLIRCLVLGHNRVVLMKEQGLSFGTELIAMLGHKDDPNVIKARENMKLFDAMERSADDLRDFLISLVHARFAEELDREASVGPWYTTDFKIMLIVKKGEPCRRCGRYHP